MDWRIFSFSSKSKYNIDYNTRVYYSHLPIPTYSVVFHNRDLGGLYVMIQFSENGGEVGRDYAPDPQNKPSSKHLGYRLSYNELPANAKATVLDFYKFLYGIAEH